MRIPICVTILLASLFLSCSQKTRSEDAQAAHMLDTLRYGEREYDHMRAYFSTDSAFQATLREQLANGDEYSKKVQRLLKSDFDHRYESNLEKRDIDGIMLSYYTINSVLNKFDRIERSYDSLTQASEDNRKVMDSLARTGDSLDLIFQTPKETGKQ
jgi:hypothetical protein